jgi:hypothetical protein
VDQLPLSITIAIALLTVLLMLTAGLRYSKLSNFERTRFVMTAFFLFIVLTLTASYWQYTTLTLPYTIPTFFMGMLLGYVVGVRTAERKLRAQGLEYYAEHFAHVHIGDFTSLSWWSLINFYTIMGGLVLINLVGLSTVIFHSAEDTVVRTSSVGAFLLGSIVPYLIHLWSISKKHHNKSTTRDA